MHAPRGEDRRQRFGDVTQRHERDDDQRADPQSHGGTILRPIAGNPAIHCE